MATVRRVPFVLSYALSWFLVVISICFSIVLIKQQQEPIRDVTLVLASADRVDTRVLETLDAGAPIVFDAQVTIAAPLQASIIVARDKLTTSSLKITDGAQVGAMFVLDDVPSGAGRWSTSINSGNVVTRANNSNVPDGALVVFSGSSGTSFDSIESNFSPLVSVQTGALLLPNSEVDPTIGFRGTNTGVLVDSASRMHFACTELGFLEQDRVTVSDFIETFTTSFQVQSVATPVSLVRLRVRVTGAQILDRASGSIGACTIKLILCGVQLSGVATTFAALACSVQLQWNVEFVATASTSAGFAKIELGSQTTSSAFFATSPRFQWVEDGDDLNLLYTFASVSNPPSNFFGSLQLEFAHSTNVNDPDFGVSIIPTFA